MDDRDQGSRHDQLIVGQLHEGNPPLHRRFRTDMQRFPEEILLLKSMSMFLTEATGIPVNDAIKRRQSVATPEKPANPFLPARRGDGRASHLEDGDDAFASLFEMELTPGTHDHRSIGSLPAGIRERMCGGKLPMYHSGL